MSGVGVFELPEGNIVCRASRGRFLIGVINAELSTSCRVEGSDAESPKFPVERDPASETMIRFNVGVKDRKETNQLQVRTLLVVQLFYV